MYGNIITPSCPAVEGIQLCLFTEIIPGYFTHTFRQSYKQESICSSAVFMTHNWRSASLDLTETSSSHISFRGNRFVIQSTSTLTDISEDLCRLQIWKEPAWYLHRTVISTLITVDKWYPGVSLNKHIYVFFNGTVISFKSIIQFVLQSMLWSEWTG